MMSGHGLSWILLLFLFPGFILAEDIHGHVKLQGGPTFYRDEGSPSDVNQGQLDVRLLSEQEYEGIRLDVHAELLALARTERGGDPGRQAVAFSSFSFIEQREARRVFDFTKDLDDSSQTDALVRIDRLRLLYQDDEDVVSIGRQALSWGNGLLFQVFDIVNPFSPVDAIKAYKSGEDMLFVQRQFSQGDDLQVSVVPRRNLDSTDVADSDSTYAIKYKSVSYESSRAYDLLAARHYEDTLLGIGVSQPFQDALIRSDVLYSRESGRDDYFSLLLNVDRSFSVEGRTLYVMLEYFFNDVGVADDRYAILRQDLSDRLARGELFTIGRHYTGSRIELEVSPLMRCSVSGFMNLEDRSGILQPACSYDWSDSIRMLGGASVPLGPDGTEFGGFSLQAPGDTDIRVEAPSVMYLRWEYFF